MKRSQRIQWLLNDTEEPWDSSTTLSFFRLCLFNCYASLCYCVSLNLRILWTASDFRLFVEISVRFSGSCWGLTSVGQNLLSWEMLNFPRVPAVSHLFPSSFPCCLAWPHPSCSGGDFPECVLLGTLAVICLWLSLQRGRIAHRAYLLFLSVEPVLLDWEWSISLSASLWSKIALQHDCSGISLKPTGGD